MNDKPSQGDILIYKNEKGDTKVDVYYIDDTVWMTQKQIATLYDKTVPAINMHIRNILTDEELTEKSTIKEYLIVQSEGTRTVSRKTNLYNLDMILAIGNTPVDSWNAFTYETGRMADILSDCATRQDSLKVLTTTIVYKEEATGKVDTASVIFDNEVHLGVGMTTIARYATPTHEEYNLLTCIPAGIGYALDMLGGYVSDLKYVFTAEGAKQLGGFGAIGSMFPPVWDWQMFWMMTAFLSIILAFMNILPIPALDGGHVMFLLYEMIFRRKPGDKFMVRAEFIGMGILFALMFVANLNDILRFFGVMN